MCNFLSFKVNAQIERPPEDLFVTWKFPRLSVVHDNRAAANRLSNKKQAYINKLEAMPPKIYALVIHYHHGKGENL
jgi:hypothetical protein